MGAPAPPSSPMLGGEPTRLVVYERELSPSNVGTIWLGRLAHGSEEGRRVQVRRIPQDIVSVQVRERLRQLARTVVHLRQPHVLKLLGVREEANEVLCISEHLQCALMVHLKRLLIESQTPMPIAVAVRVVLDAARAGSQVRHWAREQGLFAGQRLLQVDNLTVAVFGETLLRDVGVLSVVCQSPLIAVKPGVVAGLSPEELSGPRVMHPSSEVFSLGVLLWELLANRFLFSRRDEQRTTSGVISQPIPHLTRVQRAGLPIAEELARIVSRAVERDPRRRIPTLEDLADELGHLPPHLLGGVEQVTNCIRRVAGGLLGEPNQSSRWALSGQRDSLDFDEIPTFSRRVLGQDFEPVTVAERGRVLSELALPQPQEPRRSSRVSGLDLDIVVDLQRPRRRARLIGVVLLLLFLLVALMAYHSALLRIWAPGPVTEPPGPLLPPPAAALPLGPPPPPAAAPKREPPEPRP